MRLMYSALLIYSTKPVQFAGFQERVQRWSGLLNTRPFDGLKITMFGIGRGCGRGGVVLCE